MKKVLFSISTIAMAALLFSISASGYAAQTGEAESIMVYSGAGMRKPMDEIGIAFQKKYGTKVKYNYAGSQALLSQMELAKAGDAPNPIGLSVVRLEKVEGNILTIGEVDILDGTPLLDIKPYMPVFDARPGQDVRKGWYEKAANRGEYELNKGRKKRLEDF